MTQDGPVALITGGGGGLGRATARALDAAGFAVALMGRRVEPLARVAGTLGCPSVTVAADVSDRKAVNLALDEIVRHLGPPALLVNAAGMAVSAPLLPPDDELWARTMATNATGAWVTSTAVIPGMREQGGGAIVNVASTAGLRGFRFVAAYVASKHALVGLTRALAEDGARDGIRVSAVCPGFLDTEMTDRSVNAICAETGRDEAAVRASLAAMNASDRLIPPEEVAKAIVGLAQDPERSGEIVVIE